MTFASTPIKSSINRFRWMLAMGTIGILAFTRPVPESPSAEAMYKKDSVMYRIHTTRMSLENILREYGSDFERGHSFIKELDQIRDMYLAGRSGNFNEGIFKAYGLLIDLQKKALLSSPLIDFDKILLVKRKIDMTNWDQLAQKAKIIRFGFPSNHECNSSLPNNGFENELAILSGFKDQGRLETVFKPDDHGYAGEMDLHWDADRILFTKSDSVNWKVLEMDLGSGLSRQVSKAPWDVDCFDAAYAWGKNTNSVGIYLADVFDNLVLIKELPGHALLEPIPLKSQAKPPVLPDKVNLAEDDATVYIHNVYAGPGLNGVPQGTIKKIRVLAYNYGFYGMAGPDKIGYGGPWEAMQIIGTVPVEKDGSAMFKIPANMPIAFQPLDKEGAAVQLMRSWVTAMPGEFMSCVGCHEGPDEIAPSIYAQAAGKQPGDMVNWYGDPRGFDFEREVQPVLNKYCISCHDGQRKSMPDLRPEHFFPDYQGKLLSNLGVDRLHPVMMEETKGYNKYTPSYDALIPYIRRVSIEDEVNLLTPGEYHAQTSPLIQILKKGHHGVELNREAWDRLYTWIDLNGPCHGTWNDVYPVQDGVCERRFELSVQHGGQATDPETVPFTIKFDETPAPRNKKKRPAALTLEGWPLSSGEAERQQKDLVEYQKEITLGDGIKIKLVQIPSGRFVMGDVKGFPDEWTERETTIIKPFWMASCEITNAQYKAFNDQHDSRFYGKRHARTDDRGLPLDGENQPVLRVSWQEATAFCEWLSAESGMKFSLPSEQQWEYACRAGTDSPLFYGDVTEDFSPWANLGDKSFGPYLFKSGGVTHFVMDGADLADTAWNDHFVATAPVGSFRPNDWGLYDMHGNVAEWVQESSAQGEKIVRGGSFYDHPKRARSAYRLSYPKWQKVYNVGFRVVAEIEEFHGAR